MPVLLGSSQSLSRDCITVGLINNMGDEALQATERQYQSLLGPAAGHLSVRLSFYALPEIPRHPAIAAHIARVYSDIKDLWAGQLDGVIVTGREPLATNLREEPYWPAFTKIVDWAKANTHSTIWSCLAAHAAVLHLDGIERARRKEKLFGTFECARAANHRLTAGMGASLRFPHSRWNSLPEAQLTECGYNTLTRIAAGEVDTFVKQQKSLFVFFQGHPEYEQDTLLREYRRDVLRYLKQETCKYPGLPQGYFDLRTSEALTALQEQAERGATEESMARLSAVLNHATLENGWRSSAISFYRNWLSHIAAQKENAQRPGINVGATETRFAAVGTRVAAH
jgi:homoserine O-succinyltransferase/O-acetyltransferase